MEPEEYSEYFEDTILSRTPKLGQKGCYAKVSHQQFTKAGILSDWP